jgi:hypothetical protein
LKSSKLVNERVTKNVSTSAAAAPPQTVILMRSLHILC